MEDRTLRLSPEEVAFIKGLYGDYSAGRRIVSMLKRAVITIGALATAIVAITAAVHAIKASLPH